MTDELKFSQSYIAFLARLPPQAGSPAPWRIGVSPQDELEGAVVSQHSCSEPCRRSFLMLADRGHGGDREFRQRRCHDDRHHCLAHTRRRLLSQALGGFAFAGLMSIMNLADLASNNVGAFLYEHVFHNQLGPLIVVSAASTAFARETGIWKKVIADGRHPPRMITAPRYLGEARGTRTRGTLFDAGRDDNERSELGYGIHARREKAPDLVGGQVREVHDRHEPAKAKPSERLGQ